VSDDAPRDDDAVPDAQPDEPDRSPRITFRGNRHRRRFYLPWPVLALLGGLVGWLAGGWPGAIFGFVVGFLAWKLR
jgi:hypothetical protein